MTEQEADALLARIICHPDIFGGKPSIRGRRLAVEHILSDLAAGETPASILENFPSLEMDDVRACLVFAARNDTDTVVNTLAGDPEREDERLADLLARRKAEVKARGFTDEDVESLRITMPNVVVEGTSHGQDGENRA